MLQENPDFPLYCFGSFFVHACTLNSLDQWLINSDLSVIEMFCSVQHSHCKPHIATGHWNCGCESMKSTLNLQTICDFQCLDLRVFFFTLLKAIYSHKIILWYTMSSFCKTLGIMRGNWYYTLQCTEDNKGCEIIKMLLQVGLCAKELSLTIVSCKSSENIQGRPDWAMMFRRVSVRNAFIVHPSPPHGIISI